MRKLIVLCCLLAAAGWAFAEDTTSDPTLVPGTRVSPVFPPAAAAARIEATVVLAVAVQADGSVGDVEVLDVTRPNVGFERAAIDAIRQWRFDPATRNGEPVPSALAYSMTFSVPPRGATGSPYVSGFNLASTVSTSGTGTSSPTAALNNEFEQKDWRDLGRPERQMGYLGERRKTHLSSGDFDEGTSFRGDRPKGGNGSGL
jgi:TonB family protein